MIGRWRSSKKKGACGEFVRTSFPGVFGKLQNYEGVLVL